MRYKIMKKVKKHIQNWNDIRIADMPKLSEIGGKGLYNVISTYRKKNNRL